MSPAAVQEMKMVPAAEPVPVEILLIDLSSIAHPIWHMSSADPDPNATSRGIVARVRALATGKPHVAICCDAGKSFRNEVSPTYKANRPEQEAALHHQIRLAIETLEADGFPIWKVKGFEADDVIATATLMALDREEATVTIASQDKDLLQLVSQRVKALSTRDGNVLDVQGVIAKLGVSPSQVIDYLMLVGDASDNVKGADGIGPKKAAALLKEHHSIEKLYQALDKSPSRFTPGLATALREFQQRMETTRQLITLRTDAPIAFEDLFKERIPADAAEFGADDMEGFDTIASAPLAETPAPNGHAAPEPTNGHAKETAIATRPAAELVPATFDEELQPRSLNDAITLAKYMFQSRLFSAYGTPQAVLSTIMAGRELGMGVMASLRAFHIIDGKATLPADLIRALVIRSGKAQFFRVTERTAEKSTWETQRGDDPLVQLTYTIEEARKAWKKDDKAWAASGWGTNPADMLVARASSKLARLVYPDVVHTLYSTEEFDRE